MRLVGTFELGARDATARPERVGRIVRAWARYMPSRRPSERAVTWAGLRPLAPDSLRVMGEVPGLDGLFVSTGHGMLGVTTAPASAVLVGALVAEGRRDPALEPFRPGRVVRSGR